MKDPINSEVVNLLTVDRKKTSSESSVEFLFEFCWMWIFDWIKLPWHSCSMWDKLGWFNLYEG